MIFQRRRASPTAIAATPRKMRTPPRIKLGGNASPSHKVDATRPQPGTARYDREIVLDGNARCKLTDAQKANAVASGPLYTNIQINCQFHSAWNGPSIIQATSDIGTSSSAIWI